MLRRSDAVRRKWPLSLQSGINHTMVVARCRRPKYNDLRTIANVLLSWAKLLSVQVRLSRRYRAREIVRDIDLKQLSALPTATGLIAREAYARARKAKIELAPLLKEAGLTGQQIEDQDSRITVRAQIKFLNVVANALQDPLLGFHIAQTAELRKLGLLYYVGASSETLGEVLQRAARYTSTANEGLSLKCRVGPDISIELGYVGVARHLDRQQMECFMTMLLRFFRQLSGVRLMPSRLRLVHRSDNEHSEFAAYFGGNVDFSAGVDELTFARKTWDMVVVSADRYLNRLLVASCEEALSRRRASQGSFRSAVENAIVPLLPHGKAHASEISRRLGLTRRTCARRLSSEGLTFSQVLDTLRGDLARQYLADQDLSISRIAWLLGYRQVSAFTRAFKRRTGKTPRESRQKTAV
jgi:AraC-like DNA-binding protein